MKVYCRVCRYETIEAEIPDEFAKLAVERPWEQDNLTNEDYENCVKAVESVTGLPFLDDDTNADEYVTAVWSAENGYDMLEA